MKLTEVSPMAINDGWQADVQTKFAVPIYESLWSDCEVVENDTLGAEERAAKILDFGDVDKIIRIGSQQIHMAQRFRKPYSPRGENRSYDPDFTLRYSRPSSQHEVEYARLMEAHSNGASAYPRRYSFGRVHEDHNRGLYELYILDTDALIEAIKAETITEKGPIPNGEGQTFLAYDMAELKELSIIVDHWSQQSKPDDPEKITAWVRS